MEEMVQQALSKGVEMHVAGELDLASQLYGSVIKLDPNHADANHNMGLLKVDTGDVLEALPYLQTALQADTSVAQFWLSYIKALIQLDRMDEASKVLSLAKESGAEGEEFLELHQQQNEPTVEVEPVQSEADTSNQSKQNILDTLNLDKALRLAKTKVKEGSPEEANRIYQDILEKFPKNIQAQQGLTVLNKSKQPAVTHGPPQDTINHLINLYDQGQLAAVVKQAQALTQQYPDASVVWNILGAANKGLGRVGEASEAFKKVTELNPTYADGYNNLGVTLREQGKLDEAIASYNKTLSLKPDYADAYNNMGIALKDQGKLDEAIASYKKALSLKPDYAEAYNNMGIALKDQGKLEEAMAFLEEALSLGPGYADAHYNMGNTLEKQGKLDEAIASYNKALSFRPDYADSYNNMGNTLQKQGKLDEAIASYNKALSFRPDYTETFWNLSGTAENISEAKSWIEHCLRVDHGNLKARLTLSALQFYEGDKSGFNALMQTSLKDDPFIRSFKWTFDLPKLPELYFHRWALFDRMVQLSKQDRPFYEFGVWRGVAFQYLIKTFKKGYGFDTFEGIPVDWHDEKAGSYSSDREIPQIEGGEFIVGKFEKSLPEFFLKPRPVASVINFDADLYSSTICALNYSKSIIDQHTILIFDEFIMNKNWEQDEFKALNEFCLNNNFAYEVLAISFFTKQAAVRLIDL